MSGIEPPTYGLRNRCSTTELHWLKLLNLNRLIQQLHWLCFHTVTRFGTSHQKYIMAWSIAAASYFVARPAARGIGFRPHFLAIRQSIEGHLQQSLNFVQIILRLAD